MPGPWSDLPPTPPPKRAPRARPNWSKWRGGAPGARRGGREPIIKNWRGLLVIAFLLFGAPLLVNWLSHVIMGLAAGGG